MKNSKKIKNNDFICYCHQVSQATLIDAIHQGAKDLKDIQRMTGACTGGNCKLNHPEKRCCGSDIKALLAKEFAREGCV